MIIIHRTHDLPGCFSYFENGNMGVQGLEKEGGNEKEGQLEGGT